MSEHHRIPLVVQPSNRDETTNRDAKLVNGYVEHVSQQEMWVYKRPGTAVYAAVGSGAGEGLYNWNNNIYSIFNGTLYKDGVSIATGLDTTNGVYTFSSTLGATHKLVMQNGVKMYVWDGTTFTTVASNTPTVYTCSFTSGSGVVTGLSSTAGMAVGDSVSGTGIATNAYIVSIDSSTQFTMTPVATASGTSLTVTLGGFPTGMVKGLAYLDGYVNVMNNNAAIYSSNSNDPLTYPSGDYLVAQIEPDAGVCLAKNLVYVVAFKQWTTEVFYDVGNATGSPLGPVAGGKMNMGCRTADSVRELEGMLFWISQSKDGGLGVQAMSDLRANKISTAPVERLLQEADFSKVYSWSGKVAGHSFYSFTLVNNNLTLVYDLTSRQWYQWTDTNGNYLPFVSAAVTPPQQLLLQHATNGSIYQMEITSTNDSGSPIVMDLYTPNFDGGNRKRKFVHSIEAVADQTNGSRLKVRVSDDDYQSWSNFRELDLSKKRPRLTDCGTFRRRAWHFRHESDTPLRIQAVEIAVEMGEL